MQRPAVGRVVHVLVDPAVNGGQDYAAATITRVWEDGTINARVHLDTEQHMVARGIPLLFERPKPSLRAKHAAFLDTEPTVAWWPPHV